MHNKSEKISKVFSKKALKLNYTNVCFIQIKNSSHSSENLITGKPFLIIGKYEGSRLVFFLKFAFL